MILPRQPVLYVATQPVDLRCGIDKLAGVVTVQFRKGVRDDAMFVFVNRSRTRLRILFYDRTGAWLLHKRLDRGTFPLPVTLDAAATHVRVSEEELELLLEGLSSGRVERVRKPPLHLRSLARGARGR